MTRGQLGIEMVAFEQSEDEPLLVSNEEESNNEESSARQPYCSPGFRGVIESRYIASCCILITIAGLLFGYEQGAMTVVLVESQFLHRFWQIESGFYKGFLTAILELGALLGAFNQGWIADAISRKYAVLTATAIFIVGSILQTVAMEYNLLAIARFIGGVGIGMLSMVAPLYISEVSPSSIRGTLLVLQELSIVIGIVMAFWLTYVTRLIDNEWAFRLPFLLQILPALVLAIGVFFLPFSPRWLAMQGRDDEALTSLSILRQLPKTEKRVLLEWCEIRTEVMLQEEIRLERHPKFAGSIFVREATAWAELFGRCWRRTQLGIGIMFFQQFVGINALVYYAPTLLGLLGFGPDMQLKMAGVVNIAQLLGVVSSLWTMDRFGRRQLLLWGSISMFLCQAIVAALIAYNADAWQEHTTQAWVCVFLLLIYMVTFGSGWGPVPWSLPSEIFPSSLRARGVAISSCSNWLNNFIIGLITPPIVQRAGYGAYVFFALFCLLSFIWVYFLVPETAGKTLEEIDALFHDSTDSQLEEKRRQQIRRQLFSAAVG